MFNRCDIEKGEEVVGWWGGGKKEIKCHYLSVYFGTSHAEKRCAAAGAARRVVAPHLLLRQESKFHEIFLALTILQIQLAINGNTNSTINPKPATIGLVMIKRTIYQQRRPWCAQLVTRTFANESHESSETLNN